MEITANEYFERQRINKYLSALIIIFAGIVPIGSYAFSYYLFFSNFKHPYLTKEVTMFYVSGVVVILLSLFVVFLFLSLKLELGINSQCIVFRLFPFHRKFRKIPFSEIRHYTIRKFSPLLEYGGWGIRYSTKRNGIGYTISGKYGLQLELISNKRLLIGTKSPEKVLEYLKMYAPEKYVEKRIE
ncbi:MAG: hypothetical protein ACK42G_01000 [Candidatus Kapaibacteriota bacterium]